MLYAYYLCIGKWPEKFSRRQGSLEGQEMVNRFTKQEVTENSKGRRKHLQWPRVT